MIEHWQDRVCIYLTALGVVPAQNLAEWSLQFLFVPAFHHPCWLSFHSVERTLELECVMLQEPVRFARKEPSQHSKGQCWEDIVLVPDPLTHVFRALLDTFDITRLEDVDLAGRDGIFVQCWYSNPTSSHSFVMTSPTPALTPQHHKLVHTAIEVTIASLPLPEEQRYFHHVLRYLANQ